VNVPFRLSCSVITWVPVHTIEAVAVPAEPSVVDGHETSVTDGSRTATSVSGVVPVFVTRN
jgi:hypothetical protein